MSNSREKFSGYFMAALCFLFIFVNMGTLNTLGVFMSSIAQGTGYKTSQISLMFSFAGIGAALTGMFITPRALRKLGPKKCMLISTILTTAHAVIYSITSSLVVLYLAAVMAGVAIGIGIYAACGSIIGNWFVKNRLVLVGIISAGSSTGSAVINMLSGKLIIGMGYRHAYLVLAAIVIVLGLTVCILIKNRPEDIGQKQLQDETISEIKIPVEGMEAVDAKKTESFILGFIGAIVGYVAFCGVNIYNVTLLTSNYELPVDVATRYDAVLRITLAVVLFFAGKVAEKKGIKFYITLVGILFTIGVLVIILTGNKIVEMPVLLIIAMMLLAVGGTQTNANNQMMANSLFGPKAYGTIQPYFVAAGNIGLATSAFVCAPLISADGSVIGCFKLSLVCSIIWLVLELLAMACSPYLKKQK